VSQCNRQPESPVECGNPLESILGWESPRGPGTIGRSALDFLSPGSRSAVGASRPEEDGWARVQAAGLDRVIDRVRSLNLISDAGAVECEGRRGDGSWRIEVLCTPTELDEEASQSRQR
jgi:hypothetical protein